jgi:hypothetical protein
MPNTKDPLGTVRTMGVQMPIRVFCQPLVQLQDILPQLFSVQFILYSGFSQPFYVGETLEIIFKSQGTPA